LGVFTAILGTAGAITYIITSIDRDSIVSLRRVFGLSIANNLLWAIPLYVGSIFSLSRHNQQASLNELVFGAFLAWSFEMLVINGAFLSSTAQSIFVGAIQPVMILLFILPFITVDRSLVYAAGLGVIMLAITTAFLLKFKTFKAEGAPITALQMLQSFLESWVSHKPAKLERYFTMYSQDQSVVTKMVVAQGSNPAALVLPGVHPGPFFPVGSYNISELIFHELQKNGTTAVVLHGVGGHERNLPTNELAKQYAVLIADTVKSYDRSQRVAKMRGPKKMSFGPTTITALGFGDHVIALLSSAPYNTDDLEPRIIDEAMAVASGLSTDLMLVDAHNSIGGKNCSQSDIDWNRVMSEIRRSSEATFELGVAHSSELAFEHGSDISDGGVTVMSFRTQGSLYTLIASDSNNVQIGLRQRIIDELKKDGVQLIELCTSDTHNAAARSLTTRGYHALGEDTNWDLLIDKIKELQKLAETRLSPGEVQAITSEVRLPLIGDRSLNDFAALTKETLKFSKAYAAATFISALVACSLALLL
jgi:putative membrane protein